MSWSGVWLDGVVPLRGMVSVRGVEDVMSLRVAVASMRGFEYRVASLVAIVVVWGELNSYRRYRSIMPCTLIGGM